VKREIGKRDKKSDESRERADKCLLEREVGSKINFLNRIKC